jgi:adenylate cyclase
LTEATILFADIEGFTEISETLQPGKIVEMLNAYFSVLTEAVEAHDGVITQFQGDAILATFNVPLRNPDHAAQAVRAAIQMRDAVAGRAFTGHRLHCRIGINTGEVVAGAVGASDRLNYTVHGDAVNLAARLEELNKEYGTRILLSESTAAGLQGIALAEVGRIPIRGRSEAVCVFTVADEDPRPGS